MGTFRATFEDKIIKTDIVFLRAWAEIELPKFYNPVYGYGKTKLLKSHRQIREERGIELEQKKDSIYISREEEEKL